MPFAKLPDVEIYYEWSGAEHLPALLLSNSLGTTLKMWDPQMEEFTRHFHVLRYDTRGHGQSRVTPGLIPSSSSAGTQYGSWICSN